MKAKITKYLLLLLVIVSLDASGQSKKVWLFNADDFFKKEDFSSALKYYQKTMDDTSILEMPVIPYEIVITNQKLKDKGKELDSTRTVTLVDYINHQIGMCYHLTDDYSHAVEHFKITAENGSYPEDIYYHANALMKVERYDEALAEFDKFIQNENAPDSMLGFAQTGILGCHYALDGNNEKMEVIVTMADTAVFNKGTSSFAAMYWGSDEKLLFTSAREGGVVFDPEKQQSEFLCDLYWTEKVDGTWNNARNFGRPLNSASHDAAGCFNNNDVIFYTRWADDDRREQHIYLARMINMDFFEAYRLDTNVNMPGYKSMHPFVTADGSTLYFSSNRPGGMGGMDIWKVGLDENGNVVTDPENLGEPINSPANEVTPFFTRNTLFFSSDGHFSIGGLDIYKAAWLEEFEYFDNPLNMGLPINSSKDDAYMIWDESMRYGFFSSDREPCDAGHCYDIYEVTNAPITISIEGYVLDSETEDPLPGATVTFKDVTYGFEPFVVTADEDGFYSSDLKQDIEVFMKAQHPGYFADAASAETHSITESTILEQDFFLNAIPPDEIEIAGIEYDFDSDKLRPKSEEILDELVEFLELNDNLVVEINSHTDNRGSDTYNMDLSKRRAQSCVNYLIKSGIPSERLIPRGYGESTPTHLVDENKKPIIGSDGERIYLTKEYIDALPTKKQREEMHQRNRRTAFKVVGEGFQLESN